MQEIKTDKGTLKVFVNGTPNLQAVPKDEWDSFISALERQVFKTAQEDNK